MTGVLRVLPVNRILPNPANPRGGLNLDEEFLASVRARGVLQPITVQPHPGKHGMWMILYGHRRHAAARAAKLGEIPAIVRPARGPDSALEDQLIENLQRTPMTAAEKAQAFGKLRGRGYSVPSIAARTGLSPSTISAHLRLLDLDDASLRRVQDGTLPAADAVQAVRATRHQQRYRNGLPPRKARLRYEPDHFSPAHPLAEQARKRCEAEGHTMRRQLGKTACGQCWEAAIRDDQAGAP
jgi:ParB family transcriptional regulator, chromosome partitioning protein